MLLLLQPQVEFDMCVMLNTMRSGYISFSSSSSTSQLNLSIVRRSCSLPTSWPSHLMPWNTRALLKLFYLMLSNGLLPNASKLGNYIAIYFHRVSLNFASRTIKSPSLRLVRGSRGKSDLALRRIERVREKGGKRVQLHGSVTPQCTYLLQCCCKYCRWRDSLFLLTQRFCYCKVNFRKWKFSYGAQLVRHTLSDSA